jgi:hypothetical protein
MERIDLCSMSVDELLDFHEQIAAKLAAKLIAKKRVLEKRLRLLTPLTQTEPPNSSIH